MECVRASPPHRGGDSSDAHDLLRENELIYGRLLPVEERHLIERYNKALKAFGLKATKLKTFEIDRTGFSPQVAEELGDPFYLDPNEVNRRFISSRPTQIDLPVVHTAFSNTSQLIHEFMSKNQRAIDALTIKDVIYGEIEDSVAKVESIEDLLSINQVEFRVLSAEDVLGKASELGTLVDRLKREPGAWRDNAMLERMVELAKVTGDIRENALVPDQVIFRHNAYLDQPFRRSLCLCRSRHDDCDQRSGGAGFPPLTAVAGELSVDPRRRPRVSLPRGLRAHRTAARLLDRDVRLPRAPRGNGDPRADPRSEPKRDVARADKVWLQTWIHGHADTHQQRGDFSFPQRCQARNCAVRSAPPRGRRRRSTAFLSCAPGPTIRTPG